MAKSKADPYISRVLVNPNIEVDRTVFPFTLPVFSDFEKLDLDPEVTFFVGENGSGKSTLLEAIAIAYGMSAEGGTSGHSFSTFDSHSKLSDSLLLVKLSYPAEKFFLRAETFYNLASYLERSAREVGRVPRFGWIHERSHGEGFLDTVKKLKGDGMYFFDEPESALSIQGLLTFLAIMQDLIDRNSQIVIATHSPILLGLGAGRIYEFSADGIAETRYHDTQNYRITLDFLQNRGRFAKIMGLAPIEGGKRQ